MLYNTNFEVKYHTIKHELLDKLEQSLKQDFHITDGININDFGYNKEDVLNICEKLYRDELLSVLGINNFLEDQMLESMNCAYNVIITNSKFNLIVAEITNKLKQEFIDYEETELNDILLIGLFSENVFYITHKCIYQHIQLNTIDDILLIDLRKALLDYFGFDNC